MFDPSIEAFKNDLRNTFYKTLFYSSHVLIRGANLIWTRVTHTAVHFVYIYIYIDQIQTPTIHVWPWTVSSKRKAHKYIESESVKINILVYWSSGIGYVLDHLLAQILLKPQPLKPSWKSFCWMPVHWDSLHIQEESWCSGQCCHGWQGPTSCTLLHRMHISVPILQIAGCEWPVLVPGPRKTIPYRVVPPWVLLGLKTCPNSRYIQNTKNVLL